MSRLHIFVVVIIPCLFFTAQYWLFFSVNGLNETKVCVCVFVLQDLCTAAGA